MSNPYVFFFSERCPHSEKFYNLLRQNGKLSMFRLVCIDRLRKIPSGITSVPTIIVPEYNVPLVGDDVFNWLQSFIRPPQFNQRQNFNRNQQNNKQQQIRMPNQVQNQQIHQQRQQQQPQPNRRNLNTGNKSGIPKESAGKREKIHAKGEIQPFCVLEMNSKLSDNFSFIDGENNGKSAEHSYQFLPNMENKVDYSMTMNEREIKNSSNQKSGKPKSRRDIKRDKFESDLEKFRKERDSLTNGQRMQRRIG